MMGKSYGVPINSQGNYEGLAIAQIAQRVCTWARILSIGPEY